MAKKKKKKSSKKKRPPKERPASGWGPDSVKGLRWEQRKLRDLADQCLVKRLPMNNKPGSERRTAIKDVLDILNYRDRYSVSTDLLDAVRALVTYNDRLAGLIMNSVAGDYEDLIDGLKAAFDR